MPKFQITSPDGRKFEVTAPEGATQEQVLAYVQQQSKPAEAPQAEDPGMLGAASIGLGRGMDRLAAGLKSGVRSLAGDKVVGAVDRLGSMLGMADSSQLDNPQAQQQNTEIFNRMAQQQPAGAFAGEFAAGLPGKTPLGMAALGALEYGTPEERAMRAGTGFLGAKAGEALANGVAKFLQPSRGVPDAAIADAVGAAERIGYKAPAGQATGSKVLQAIEQQLAKNPMGSGSAQAFNEGNQQAINAAAARAMGENATKLTDDVLSSAEKRISAQFQEVAARNNVTIGDDFTAALARLKAGQDEAGPFANRTVDALVQRGMLLAERGEISGKAYQSIRSALGKQAKDAFSSGRSELGQALKTVQRGLDDAADASISEADKAVWAGARKQWQALKLVNTKNGIVEGGNVSAAKLANKVDKAGKVNAQELRDIAKIGETFKPLPDSGTAGNLLTQALLTGGAGLAGPGALLTSMALPAAASKAVFSDAGRKYLTNGLLDVSPEALELMKRLGVGAGGSLGLLAGP